jgi:hypothetical protein
MSNLLDFCRMTSATGGTGALTCTAQTGYPAVSDAITGTRFVNYSIAEYTSSAKTQLSQAETGIGSYVASTGILTRTAPKTTWASSAYLPKFGTATAPTALSFGTTSANIDITVSPVVFNGSVAIPFQSAAVANVSDGLGSGPLNMSGSGTLSATSGLVYYSPILLPIPLMYSQFSLRSTATLTGGSPTLDCSLYEIANDGMPGRALVSFNQITGFGTIGNYSSSALSTPIFLPPAWYWQGFCYNAGGASGTFGTKGSSNNNASPAGMLFASGYTYALTVTGTLTDPATAPTGFASGGNNNPTIVFK